MMSFELHNLVAEVMNVPASIVNDRSSPETIANWDSFHLLILVDTLETTFNVKFTLDEVLNTKTVSDIKQNLENHGISFQG